MKGSQHVPRWAVELIGAALLGSGGFWAGTWWDLHAAVLSEKGRAVTAELQLANANATRDTAMRDKERLQQQLHDLERLNKLADVYGEAFGYDWDLHRTFDLKAEQATIQHFGEIAFTFDRLNLDTNPPFVRVTIAIPEGAITRRYLAVDPRCWLHTVSRHGGLEVRFEDTHAGSLRIGAVVRRRHTQDRPQVALFCGDDDLWNRLGAVVRNLDPAAYQQSWTSEQP